jgi:hypothetical protein
MKGAYLMFRFPLKLGNETRGISLIPSPSANSVGIERILKAQHYLLMFEFSSVSLAGTSPIYCTCP